jgi:SWIM/SEC-C metal-binding protein
MASIGTTKRPAIIRVQTEDRATEVMNFCNDKGIIFILGLEPDKPEDISDVERALQARQPALPTPKIGRNEPCPCGSGKKFKKCCEGLQPETAS